MHGAVLDKQQGLGTVHFLVLDEAAADVSIADRRKPPPLRTAGGGADEPGVER